MFLSADQNYIMTLLPEIIQKFQHNSFVSNEKLEADFQQKIEIQAKGFATSHEKYPVVLPIHGAIVKHTNWNFIGTQTYIRYIKQLDAHPDVSAIVLDIDSGGGMVSGTAELAHTIRQCQKPIVAFTNGYMCSAAYHIAAACDKVVSSPFSDYIGSIGTMLHAQDFSQMFEKWGAKIYEVYAPQSEEKNKVWRDLKAENDTTAKEHLSVLAEDFIQTMKAYRPQISDDGKVFQGAIYTAEKAKAIGLIDEIMTLRELLNEL